MWNCPERIQFENQRGAETTPEVPRQMRQTAPRTDPNKLRNKNEELRLATEGTEKDEKNVAEDMEQNQKVIWYKKNETRSKQICHY